MAITRKISKVLKGKPTMEGAGVHLKRVFGYSQLPLFDPFLMLDDFRSDTPEHYIKGFPWHPHRGIETITYVLKGDVEHGDSLGNRGIIGSGDVQWMTAGSGIIHQEMPIGDERGRMYGFQLWANLPSRDKMKNPKYRDIVSSQIPEVKLSNGTVIKIICGEVSGVKGPVDDIVIEPEYLDISVPANTEFTHPTKQGSTVFTYVIDGEACFSKEKDPFTYEVEDKSYLNMNREQSIQNGEVILFEDGDEIKIITERQSVRFLFISGKPLKEPVAWGGPIVMNTQEELETAFEEYKNGTFIKYKG
jgi:quercetin 2,3-dioxygenase